MYVTSLKIMGTSVCEYVYQELQKLFNLPSLDDTYRSLSEDMDFSAYGDIRIQYLESSYPVLYINDSTTIIVSYKPFENSKEYNFFELTFMSSRIVNIEAKYPGKSGKVAASNLVGILKKYKQDTGYDFPILLRGFREDPAKQPWIRANYVAMFKWVDPLNRYVYAHEDISKFSDL